MADHTRTFTTYMLRILRILSIFNFAVWSLYQALHLPLSYFKNYVCILHVRSLFFGWFRKGSRISCFSAVIFLHKLGVLVLSYYYRVLEVCGTSCCRKKSSYIRKDFLSLIEFPSRMGLLGKVIRARIKFQEYYWSVVPNRTKIRSFCLLSLIDRKCTSCIRWFSSKIIQWPTKES